MNQDQISQIRKELVESDPGLNGEQLTDEKIEAAVDKVVAKPVNREQYKEEAKPVVKSPDLANIQKQSYDSTPTPKLPETTAPDYKGKEFMVAMLNELSGSTNNTRVDNPDLANYVDQVLDSSDSAK